MSPACCHSDDTAATVHIADHFEFAPLQRQGTEVHIAGRDAVLTWLLTADEEDAKEVLVELQSQKPSLFGDMHKDSEPSEVFGSASKAVRETHTDKIVRDSSLTYRELPIVQFSCFIYYCIENEEACFIDVVRIGNVSGKSEVRYTTKDDTAVAGVKYKATSGTLVFEPHETQQSIKIDLISDEDWDTTTEFLVQLTHDPESSGCQLGRYLWTSRVKVVDDDTFPSNKHQEIILARNLKVVNRWSLLWEYIKMNGKNKVVKKGTIRMVFCDMLHNLYFFLNIVLNVYLVDKVLEKQDLDKPVIPLLLIAAAKVVPLLLLHFLDVRRLTWKVMGASRATLQKALIRKFLNYTEESRSSLTRSDLVMACTRDVENLTSFGYGGMLILVKLLGQLFFILLFQVVVPLAFEKDLDYIPFVVFFLFPLLQIAFLLHRNEVTTGAVGAKNDVQDEMVEQVDKTATNYDLVAGYNRRAQVVASFEAYIRNYNDKATHASIVVENNSYCAKWMTVVFVSFYMVIGGLQYKDDPDSLPLGLFLANVSIILTIGEVQEKIYGVLLQMQANFPALTDLVTMINLPTDIVQRMQINRSNRRLSNASPESTADLTHMSADLKGFKLDHLNLRVNNLKWHWNGGQCSQPGLIEIGQGELALFLGPQGSGKSTLMKLFGGHMLPDPGGFFVPSHLRTFHIASFPLFFVGTLYENIIFGINSDDPDANEGRVRSIATRLGLPDEVLKLIYKDVPRDSNEYVQNWSMALSFTQQCLISLARALTANPELMAIHKPTMAFDEQRSAAVMALLREYIDAKGIEQDMSARHRRRPRTLVMSSSKMLGVAFADRVFLVKQSGIEAVEHDEKGRLTYEHVFG